MISKRHCAIVQRDNKVFIQDFGSTNGTSLNDQPVKDEIELHDADRLKIGPLHFEAAHCPRFFGRKGSDAQAANQGRRRKSSSNQTGGQSCLSESIRRRQEEF